VRSLGRLLWKDALAELRGAERLSTLGLFAGAVLLTLQFSLPPVSRARPQVAAGFLWATVIFAALFELRRSFDAERRDGTLDGLRASPVDPTIVFVAKVGSSLLVLGVLVCALVPLVVLFFGGRPAGVPAGIGISMLGLVGLVCWGTLLAAMVTGTRAGEVVLPILLFPLIVPQTIACVRLLAHHLAGIALTDHATGIVLLLAFDVLAVGTSLLLFEYVLEE
jgi:heme exporter protein B